MNILALDTSSSRLLVALKAGGKTFAKTHTGGRANQALMPLIDALLKQAGISIRCIDRFAAVVGPGSFTGIRVGVSVINAFCHATGKPAAGVTTLELLGIEQSSVADGKLPEFDADYDPEILLRLAQSAPVKVSLEPFYMRKPQAERLLDGETT